MEWEGSFCRMSARVATVFFFLENCTWWVSTGHEDGNNGKKHCSWCCAACGGPFDWRAPNRILVVQLGANANEAQVFRAHAAPQGLCDNFVRRITASGESAEIW